MELLHRVRIRRAQPLGCHNHWLALRVRECGEAVVNLSSLTAKYMTEVEQKNFCDIDWSKYKCDVVCSVYADSERILYSARAANFVQI